MHSIVLRAGTVALLLTFGQSNGQAFAGQWTCEYFGRTLARLDLQDVNASVTGRMSIGYFHVDSDGKLDVVIEQATVFTPIFDVVLRDGVLSFTKENDGTPDRYELRVSGDTRNCRFCRLTAIEGGEGRWHGPHSQYV
jgi:hypothetical protein